MRKVLVMNLTGQFFRFSLGTLILMAICLSVWTAQLPNINWDIALTGFSPIDWVNHSRIPQNFIRDFPQGSQSYNLSLFMYVYRIADSIFGIDPVQLIPWVILFEMFFMGAASVIFFRALIPHAIPVAALVFAILVVNSGARSMELAGFGGPFFWGLYYNFADGMRLIAIAMLLQRRFMIAGLLFALSVMTHPLMGMMGIVFALGCLLSGPSSNDRNKIFLAAIVFLLPAGGWWIFHLQGVAMDSIGIPSSTWIAFSKAFSFHFYPVNNGMLTFEFERRLLAFLSLLILAIFFIFRINLSVRSRNAILLGGTILLFITLVGLSISYWSNSPALIKLTLTRASDMLILVSLAVVVSGLITTIYKGRFFPAAIASGLLLSPLIATPFPVIYVFLIIISTVDFFKFKDLTAYDKTVFILLIIFGIFIFIYYLLGFVHDNYQVNYLGNKSLWLLSFCIGIWALISDYLGFITKHARRLCSIAVLVLIVFSTLNWKSASNHGSFDKPLGVDYLSVQLWAKESTPPTALFMVDPTIYYGWRDFSQRSSFGNVREWLHTSWGYDSKSSNYEEGVRRASEFGISPEKYLNFDPPIIGTSRISEDISYNFYSNDENWFKKMASKYDINYLVMKKARMNHQLPFPLAYQNEYFIVYKLQ